MGNTKIMVEVQNIASNLDIKRKSISYCKANHQTIYPLKSEDSVRIYSEKWKLKIHPLNYLGNGNPINSIELKNDRV